jgi:hypothetical protein
MKGPAVIAERKDYAEYYYPVIHRRTQFESWTDFTQVNKRFVLNLDNNISSDPIIALPQSAKLYKNCRLDVDLSVFARIASNSGPDRQITMHLVAWNDVGNNAHIKIDGSPLTVQFTKRNEQIELPTIPNVIDLSSIGIVAVHFASLNTTSWPINTLNVANCVLAFIHPVVRVFNNWPP